MAWGQSYVQVACWNSEASHVPCRWAWLVSSGQEAELGDDRLFQTKKTLADYSFLLEATLNVTRSISRHQGGDQADVVSIDLIRKSLQ